MKQRGVHNGCDNDKPHLSPADCWEQYLLSDLSTCIYCGSDEDPCYCDDPMKDL